MLGATRNPASGEDAMGSAAIQGQLWSARPRDWAQCFEPLVEDLLSAAGLQLAGGGEASCPFRYPDLGTAWRGLSAAGPVQRVIQLAGVEATRAVCDEVHSQYRQPDGTIRQDNV